MSNNSKRHEQNATDSYNGTLQRTSNKWTTDIYHMNKSHKHTVQKMSSPNIYIYIKLKNCQS